MAANDIKRLKQELETIKKAKQQIQQTELAESIAAQVQRQEEATEENDSTKNGGGKFGKGLLYLGEELGLGLVRGIEGVGDFVVGGVADLFGEDAFAERVMKNDWLNYSHADEWFDPGKGWEFAGDVASGVGGMLPSVAAATAITLATGGAGAGAGATMLAQGVGTTLFGLGAAGQATSEAVKETGELGGKEWLYGAGSGALEAGIEAISGGIGGSQVGKVFGKKLAKSTAGKIATTVVGEGLEEVASDVTNPLLRRVTGLDKSLAEAYKDVDAESLLRTFAVGGLTGAVMGGGSTAIGAIKSKGYNNYAAAQTAEQVSEWKADTNKSQAEGKKSIYKQKDIAKVAENLSKRLQNMDDTSRSAFLEHNANIAYMFNADGTVTENAAVEAKKGKKERAQLNPEGTTENIAPTTDTNSGSYNPDAYSAGLKGYESKLEYKPVSSSSKVSSEVKGVMNTLAKISRGKANIVLTDADFSADGGTAVNGLYKDGIIYLNANATDYQKALAVGVHEVVHTLEGTKDYDNLARHIADVISKDPALQEKYNQEKYRKAYDALLSGDYTETTKNYQASTEIFADYIANELAGNEASVKRLINKDRNIVVRILDWVKNAIAKLGMSKEERTMRKDLEKLENLLSNALKAGTGGRPLEDVEKTARAAEKAHLEDEMKKKKAAQTEETDETAETIDKRSDVVYNKAQARASLVAKYINVPQYVRNNLYGQLNRLYDGISDGIADGIALSYGNDIYIVDSGKDQGELDFAVRRKVHISDATKRAKYIKKINQEVANDGRSERRILEKLGVDMGDNSRGNVGRLLREDVSNSQRESKNQQNRVSQEGGDRGVQVLTESTSRKSIDVEYANAIKDGDTALAQKMVDQAAKEAGYDKKRFHETKEENIIHVFNLDLNTNASADYGTPFGVFTKKHNRSVGLGGKQMSLYVKADRTFSVKDRTETPKRLPQAYTELVDKINAIDSEYDAKYEKLSDDLLDSFAEWLDENAPNDEMRNAWDVQKTLEEQFGDVLPQELIEKERKFLKVRDEWDKKTNQAILDAKKWLTKWLRENHYDSMELEFDNGAGNRVTDALIVLDQEQVKSAEPATYDDNGNLIPLSKRFNKKSADIRYSLPVDVETDVKKHYGSTYNWKETGYILQDGTRLDLSGRNEGARGGYRQVDHRDIFAIFEEGDYSYGTEAMVEFMGRGNIRVMPETPGINLQVEPNAEQYRLIQDFVERVGWKEGYFSVDIDNKNGDTIETLTYEGKPSGRKVVADLKYYFKEGKVPYKSNLSAFRYSIDVDADIADFPSIDKWFDALTAEELRELIDNDYTVEDISEELNVDTKKMRYLIRREGLGNSYVEDSKKAVMKQTRIDEAIDDSGASNPTYARDYITAISPKDFIDLTVRTDHVDRESFDREVIGDHGGIMSEWDYEKALQTSRSPYLQIDKATGRVIGHNGRHRIRALEKAGIQSVEIQVEFFDEDGRLIKYDSETIPKMAISSQFDTDIETTISKVIPLNESHRAEIEATYGEKAIPKAGVRYALDAELAKKTSDRVQTIVKDKGVIRQTISDIREGKKSVKETWDAIMEELKYGERARWIEIQIALTDQQAGIAKAAKNLDINVNGEIQRARAAKAAALNMLIYKQTDFAGNVVGESLREIFDPIQKKGAQYAQNFNEYLLHQLNIDRMSLETNGVAEGIENKPVFQADVTAEFSKERIAELDKQHPTFKDAAEKVWKYNKNLLQYRVDAGLITQEQADLMNKMYPHYVPAFYDTTNVARTGVSGGKNRVAVRTGIKAAKGSSGKADIIDVSLAISRQTESVVRAAAINNLVTKLYDKAVETSTFIDLDVAGQEKLTDPNVDYDEKIAKDNQVVFYKNGEKITLDVSEYMYAGFEGLGLYKRELNNPLESVTTKGVEIFKKLVTSWNPLFAATNAMKDLSDALFNTRYNVFKYMGRYVQSAFRFTSKKDSEYRKLWDAYRGMGGFQAGFYKGDLGAYDKRSGLRKGIARFTNALNNLNDYIEQIPRFAEFVASVKAGNSYEKALYDAADVTTNFSRGGSLVRKLNRSWIPFLNPAVQGWSKMYRTWVDPMDRLSEKELNKMAESTKGKKLLSVYGGLVLKTLVLGFGAGALNDLLFRWIDEDEDYEKLPLNVKENYYLIKSGDKFVKIPKGRVTALLGTVSTRVIEYLNGNEEALDAWNWFTTAWGMVSPIDAASRHIASPVFDVLANRTWYGTEIESRTMEQMYEAKDRYDESTSSIAIAIGQALNWSPKKIHYFLDQYSGVLGDIILPMTTNKAEQGMIAARFVVDPLYTNNISNEYYNLKEELTYAKSAKDLSAMMVWKYLNKSDEKLSEIYQLKRDVANYEDLSIEEKKLLISKLKDAGLVDISNKETLTDVEKREITNILQALLNGTLAQLTENVETFEQIALDNGFEDKFSKFIYSDMYIDFDEKKKNTAYNKAMGYYYELYMSKMLGVKLIPKYALYDAIGANETALYLTEISKIESDKDRNGDTITGSRKKKVHKYIQGLKLTVQQKNILMYLAGYTPTDAGKGAVTRYLLANGYTRSEVNDIWKD